MKYKFILINLFEFFYIKIKIILMFKIIIISSLSLLLVAS